MKLFNKFKLALLGSSLSIGAAVAINANTAIQTKADESVTTVTDVITADKLPAANNRYAAFSDLSFSSESKAKYTGTTNKRSTSSTYIQFTQSSKGGLFSSTSGGILKSVVINYQKCDEAGVNVFASSSSFGDLSYLYGKSISAYETIDLSSTDSQTDNEGIYSNTIAFSDDSFRYIGFTSTGSAVQLDSISITWELTTFGTLDSIEVTNPGKTDFVVGETYSSSDLVVIKKDTDGNQENIPSSDIKTSLDGHVFTEKDVPSVKNKVIYNGKESEEFEIKVSSLPTFKKVTANKEDWTGTYLIVAEKNSVLYAADSSLDDFDVINSYKNVTSEEDCIKASSTLTFKIAKFQTGYSIQKQNGEFIGSSGSTSSLKISSSPLLNEIELDETGQLNIYLTNGDTTSYLRFNTTKTQMRFKYYAKTYGASISLYEYQAPVSESLTAWANQINNTLTCDNGNTTPSVETWNDIKSNYFDSKISGVDLETIRSETGNANGTVLQQALAKYDYIVSKYGDSTYSNYLGRNLVIVNKSQLLNNHSISSSSLITIISILGVGSCIGIFLLLRRKKEN